MEQEETKVRIFFSYTNDDPSVLPIKDGWYNWLYREATDTFYKGFDLYDWAKKSAGILWPDNQKDAINLADLFVPFITAPYLTREKESQRYHELEQALGRFKAGKLDICPVIVRMPNDKAADQDHWSMLQQLTFLDLGMDEVTHLKFNELYDLPDKGVIPPNEAQKFFRSYLNDQYSWRDGGCEGPRPLWKQYARLAELVHSYAKESPLVHAIRLRWPSGSIDRVQLPNCVRSFQGDIDLSDPCVKATIDELILRLDYNPSDALLESWLNRHLSFT